LHIGQHGGASDEGRELEQREQDLQLTRRLVAGDAAAWREFVVGYERLVFARVADAAREARAELDRAALDDLCAAVFAQLVARDYAALRQFAGRSRLSTWLAVVARRVCLRAPRRERVQGLAESRAAEEMTVEGGGDDPLAEMVLREDRDRLAAGWSQLNPRQRAVAELYYHDGLSYREIGDRLGMPVNSIGPTLKRVEERLRDLVGRDET
jgi:RNA polymerase sigma-70 factor (ECF subfamily)